MGGAHLPGLDLKQEAEGEGCEKGVRDDSDGFRGQLNGRAGVEEDNHNRRATAGGRGRGRGRGCKAGVRNPSGHQVARAPQAGGGQRGGEGGWGAKEECKGEMKGRGDASEHEKGSGDKAREEEGSISPVPERVRGSRGCVVTCLCRGRSGATTDGACRFAVEDLC